MTQLYSKLSRAYHEMYQFIFDYKKEFSFYNDILKAHNCVDILEIGCGSGNLASFFLQNGYNYTGLDLSNDMLAIASEVAPNAKFIHGDMRSFSLNGQFDAILITGRSVAYLTTNKDMLNTLDCINKHLQNGGLLIFDCFDAAMVFGSFRESFVNSCQYGSRHYKRVSRNTISMEHGLTWKWDCTYHITENGKTETIDDSTLLRGFTKDELSIFLKLKGFSVMDFIEVGSVVFVVVLKE